jgi:micrococcal nuclease
LLGPRWRSTFLVLASIVALVACGGGVQRVAATPGDDPPSLRILEPVDGAEVTAAGIVVTGVGPAGARIVRDISLGPDDVAIADASGAWSMPVELEEGANELVFRIGDDQSTAVELTVSLAPPIDAGTPTPASQVALGSAPTGDTVDAQLVRVTDGDTIRVRIAGKVYPVRYIGIDTPEVDDPRADVRALADAATKANAALLKGRRIRLETDVSETDQYGRLLRYIWVSDTASPTGWTLVNLELVRRGFAQALTYPPDVKYAELYAAAQEQAREAGVGQWAPAATPKPTPLGFVTQPKPKPTKRPSRAGCDPSYPTVCIPPRPPDLDCGDIEFRGFEVRPPDPHRFDGDHDGIGCERG